MRKCTKSVPTRNVLAAAMALALFSTDVLSTILVTSGGDPDPNRADTCSLRQALNQPSLRKAGNCVETNSVHSSSKYIEMAPALANSTITLEHGELLVDMSFAEQENLLDMQMRGVTIDAHHASRVFHLKGHDINPNAGESALLRMIDVRITGGAATSADCAFSGCNPAGGGIYSENVSVVLTRSIVSGNTASVGGGISGIGGAEGTSFSDWPEIYLFDSTLDGNVASMHGGGIFVRDLRVTMVRSTISNNSAHMYGGGIATYRSAGTVRHPVYGQTQLLESTVSGNQVSEECVYLSGNYAVGAGIYAYNNRVIANGATISGNHGGCAGAAIDVSGPDTGIDLRNSIVSGNHASESFTTGPAEIARSSYGEGPTAANTCILGAALSSGGGRGVGNTYTDAPMLEPLANHGGTTATMRPLASSPAIDHGDDAGCASRLTFVGSITDQRFVVQPQGLHCDIGSFEVRQGSFTIAANVTGSGRIDALPLPTGAGSSGGISNCTSAGGSACAATFVGENNDATLMLTPTPAVGWHLATWTGDCIGSAIDTTASLTIDAAHTCNAIFAIDTDIFINGFEVPQASP